MCVHLSLSRSFCCVQIRVCVCVCRFFCREISGHPSTDLLAFNVNFRATTIVVSREGEKFSLSLSGGKKEMEEYIDSLFFRAFEYVNSWRGNKFICLVLVC